MSSGPVDVAGLTTDLHEHARYGEPEELLALVQAHIAVENPALSIDAVDAGGSTALHKAAANGEMKCVQILIEHKASYLPNKAGATALGWAVLNRKEDAVKVLLEAYDDVIDVLAVQDTNKSNIVTYAFNAKNQNILQMILEHKSSDDGEDGEEVAAEDAESAAGRQQTLTHEFAFLNDVPVHVRELSEIDAKENVADEDLLGLADEGKSDVTGLYVWSASIVLSRFIVKNAGLFHGKRVLELGAGCGLPGLVVAKQTNATSVILSDFQQRTVENLEHNISLNTPAKKLSITTAALVDWKDKSTFPEGKFDVIVGSDLVYHEDLVGLLQDVVADLLAEGGVFLYCHAEERNGVSEFISKLSRGGVYEHKQVVPTVEAGYFENPLRSKDDNMAELCFTELSPEAHIVLHSFTKVTTTTTTAS